MSKVLLVDDHQVVRDGLKTIIREQGIGAVLNPPGHVDVRRVPGRRHVADDAALVKVDHDEMAVAYRAAAEHDDLVIVEEFVAGVELTASILGERALPLIRIEAPEGNYDYHHKYFSDETKYFCPCGVAEEVECAIQSQSLEAFRVIGCNGWGRLDLILQADGTWQFLEVNTIPGMTGHSLVPMAAKRAGIEFPDLCVEILRGAHVG